MDDEQPAGAPGPAEEMFARSWRLTSAGGPTREALNEMVDVLLPEMEAIKGFVGVSLLVDRQTGDLLATTYWDSREHLVAARTREVNAARGALVLAGGDEMSVAECDVVLSSPPPGLRNRRLGRDD